MQISDEILNAVVDRVLKAQVSVAIDYKKAGVSYSWMYRMIQAAAKRKGYRFKYLDHDNGFMYVARWKVLATGEIDAACPDWCILPRGWSDEPCKRMFHGRPDTSQKKKAEPQSPDLNLKELWQRPNPMS